MFYPEITPRANRATQLAIEFVRSGHKVTVMMPNVQQKNLMENTDLEGIDFIDLGKLKLQPFTGDSLFQRIMCRGLQLLFEYPDIELSYLIYKNRRLISGYNLIISIAVPHPNHWGMAFALKNNKSNKNKWLADCGDPYMGCKTDTFKKLFYFKYLEKYWCKKCDAIIVPEASAKAGYYAEFQQKIHIIPQGFDLDKIAVQTYSRNYVPTFAYAGVLAPHYRNPFPLLDFLKTVQTDFKFIVYNQTNLLDKYVAEMKGKLEVRNYIPREQLLPVLATMDFLINFENNTTVQVPSKLIDYAIVNRPVLSVSTEIDTQNVMRFLNHDFSNKMIMPDLSVYDIRNVAESFIHL